METWFGDLIFGLRVLRKSPVFCITAIFTLALGIGANTAIFTLLYGLLLRNLPVPHPQQLARINIVGPTEAIYWSSNSAASSTLSSMFRLGC
jgi:hypothetical protein